MHSIRALRTLLAVFILLLIVGCSDLPKSVQGKYFDSSGAYIQIGSETIYTSARNATLFYRVTGEAENIYFLEIQRIDDDGTVYAGQEIGLVVDGPDTIRFDNRTYTRRR